MQDCKWPRSVPSLHLGRFQCSEKIIFEMHMLGQLIKTHTPNVGGVDPKLSVAGYLYEHFREIGLRHNPLRLCSPQHHPVTTRSCAASAQYPSNECHATLSFTWARAAFRPRGRLQNIHVVSGLQ